MPIPITVTVDEAGIPVEVRLSTGTCVADNASLTDARLGTAASPTTARRVAEVLEVWRIDDEWWRAPITRRYVDVVLEGGAHVVLFEDLRTAEWFVQQP